MTFNIHAALANGSTVFTATLNYLPRLDEEIEVNGHVFVIKRIRHLIRE